MARFKPFWLNDKIDGEILVFCEKDGAITANLTFDNPRKVKIKDINGNMLQENVDYSVNGRVVTLINKEHFYFKDEWLRFENVPNDMPCENNLYNIKGCLLVEPKFLRSKQYIAEYECDITPFPEIISDRLGLYKSYKKLKDKKELKLALFGDSISNAANSSFDMGFGGSHWIDSAIRHTEELFGAKITFYNHSRSGYGTEWAITAVKEKFANDCADLIIIAFGMNDGTAGLTSEAFIDNVKTIIAEIKKINPEAEFILVATPLPNSACKQLDRYQKEYFNAMRELDCDGVSVVNMTAACKFFMERKNYIEISGNNLNHPNDFFYSVYTDTFTELFYRLKEKYENRLICEESFVAPFFEEREFSELPKNIKAGYLVNKVNGLEKKTFAFVAYPEKLAKKCPAVVLVHGAGGNAFYKWAENWAKRGYVAISLDLNCTCFANDNLSERQANPFAGELFIGGFYHVGKNPYESWIYYSVSQIISANSYLRTLDIVDESKIGLVGISWGGVTSLIALGNDQRFAIGGIIYSCGFITEDLLGNETGIFTDYEKKRFYDCYFDARNYVDKIDIPVILNAGLDDGAFAPFSRERTYAMFKKQPTLAVIPKLFHDNESNFDNKTVASFFDGKLLGNSERVNLKTELKNGDIFFETDKPVDRVELCYSRDKLKLHAMSWNAVEVDSVSGKARIPENATFAMLVVYYGQGLYTSGKLYNL